MQRGYSQVSAVDAKVRHVERVYANEEVVDEGNPTGGNT